MNKREFTKPRRDEEDHESCESECEEKCGRKCKNEHKSKSKCRDSKSRKSCHKSCDSSKRKSRGSKRGSRCESKRGSKCKSSRSCSNGKLCRLVKYIKKRMNCDKCILPHGSDAYAHIYNTSEQALITSQAVTFDTNHILHNIDHENNTDPDEPNGSPNVYIRRDGIYSVMYSLLTDQESQFTIFLNGKALPLTTTGKRSGAGQLIIKAILPLKRDDVLTLRNYTSTSLEVDLIDGLLLARINGAFCNIVKIASLPKCRKYVCYEELEKMKRKYCFHEILEKILCDNDFDLKMFDAHGDFYNTSAQNVLVETPVKFDDSHAVECLEFTAGTSKVTIKKAGIYLTEGFISTVQPCQFTMFINGAPEVSSTISTNKGGEPVLYRELTPLKFGDVVTFVNHTSPIGAVDLTVNAGGFAKSFNAKLLLMRVAQLPECIPKCEDDVFECKFEKIYDAFIEYLYKNPKLNIFGSSAYANGLSQTQISIPIEKAVDFALNGIEGLNIYHKTGSKEFIIKRDGVYSFFFHDSNIDPLQVAFAINGTVLPNAIAGTNAGAASVVSQMFANLYCGDKVTIINHTSANGLVTFSENSGGTEPSVNADLVLIRLSDIPCMQSPHHGPLTVIPK